MTKLPGCHLSVTDFHVLEQLIESDITDPAFYRLVRQKITSATIIADGIVDPQVAKIGSRVDFVIDGRLCESLILVREAGERPSRLTLPVTTMRGLALLGLRSGDEIAVELPDTAQEVLNLKRVYQPREGFRPQVGGRGRLPSDDDPGPRAA
jgi:regulator of nucleoside diphosphate kinase